LLPWVLAGDSAQVAPPSVERATIVCTTSPELTPVAVLPGGRSGAYAPSVRES
jgi:hypothetical protein